MFQQSNGTNSTTVLQKYSEHLPHDLPVQKKGKRIVGEAEEPKIESENMDLDVDLDSIFCNLDQLGDTIHHRYPMDIVDIEIFDEDESFVFKSVVFESELKKNTY